MVVWQIKKVILVYYLISISDKFMTDIFQKKIESGNGQFIANQLNAPTPVDVNVLSRGSQSGAMLACICNQPDVLQVFINGKADLRLRDCNGYSALKHAIKNIDRWLGDADGEWPRLMDKLIGQLMKSCQEGQDANGIRKDALEQLAAINVLKTVRYILRDDTYAATRDVYLSAMEEPTADETTTIKKITNKADHFGHSEIKSVCESAPGMLWEGLSLLEGDEPEVDDLAADEPGLINE